jgi:hypothetical protein
MSDSYLTEQEIADYGPEMIDILRRVAAEAAAPLKAEVQNLRGQLGHVQAEAGNAFLDRMNREISSYVPNWAEINRDPAFVQWTEGVDPFSGQTARTMMQAAWSSGEGRRVAAFFLRYLGRDQPTAQPAGQGHFLAHGNLPQGQPRRSAEVNYYRRAEIKRFFDEIAAGKWRGREQQRAALEADIQRAAAEGRIVDAFNPIQK